MKIGVIIEDGKGVEALAILTRKIQDSNPSVTILSPKFAKMHPKASPDLIARAASKTIRPLLDIHRVDRVVVLIDREDRSECPGDWAGQIELALERQKCPALVVIKNRKFENWLVADVEAFEKISTFQVTKSFRNKIVPNKADQIDDAEAHINSIIRDKKKRYRKNEDARRIAEEQDIQRAACNSRSYRRFLRAVDFPDYAEQSGKPHADCSAVGSASKNTDR